MPSHTRIEYDALGEYQVPSHAYYGIYTARVSDLYNMSGIPVPLFFLRMYIRVKKIYSQINLQHGKITPEISQAIQVACRKLLQMKPWKLRKQFPLDIIQSGGGTSTNMPVNEVIANLANLSVRKQLGSYTPVHPNDHVNMSQSSNDGLPGVSKLVSYYQLTLLIEATAQLASACNHKALEMRGTLQIGRTHLQEALSMPANGPWEGYTATYKLLVTILEQVRERCLEISFGATAIGTQHQVDAALRVRIIDSFRREFGLPFRTPASYFMSTSSSADWSLLAGASITLAREVVKQCHDLRLLSAGPRTGWRELRLPSLQPGSSTMPGKVNPSGVEAVTMACWRAIALAQGVQDIAEQSQLQLQVWWPLVVFQTYEYLELLTKAITFLNSKVIPGVQADKTIMHANLDNSLVTLQNLVATKGYAAVAKEVNEALQNHDRNLT